MVDTTSGSAKKLLVSNYSQIPTDGHLSTMGTSLQWPLISKALYNSHLSTKASATKACRQLPVFSAADEKVKNGHEI